MWRLFVILGLYGCVKAGQILSPIENNSGSVTTQSAATNVKTVIDRTVDNNTEIKSPTTVESNKNPDSLTANRVNIELANKNTITTTMVSAEVKNDVNNNAKDTRPDTVTSETLFNKVRTLIENLNSPNKRRNKEPIVNNKDTAGNVVSVDSSSTNEEPRSDIKNRNSVPTRDELIVLGAENVDIVQHRVDDPFINKLNDIKPVSTHEIPLTAIKNRENVPTRDELIASGVENVDMVQHRVDGSFPFTSVDNQPIILNETTSTVIKNKNNVPTRDDLIASGVENVDMVQHRVDSPFPFTSVDNQPINLNEIPSTAIKNRDNVPTRDELKASGVENVDMVQHRVDDFPIPVNNQPIKSKETPSTAIKNKNNVPTRDDLIASGVENVDMVQHRVDSPFPFASVDNQPINLNEIPSTAIMNRDNVPTRDELIASGVENVDMVQHRVDDQFPFTSVDNQPISSNGMPSTAIKNRDNVPTRDELIASGVENADMVQHRVDDQFPFTSVDNQPISSNGMPSTAIKNRDNVPTRDELIASGVENVDMVQHRVDGSFPFTSVDSQPIKSNGISTAIKNRDNVPTRDELIASGVENVDMVQHRVGDPFINKLNDKKQISSNGMPSTAIKNRNNVPTRDELIASGVENVDMVQHQVDDQFPFTSVDNQPIKSNGISTAVKNRDNVPTRDELIASGVENVDMVQHRVDDPFINKLNDKKPISSNGMPSTAIKNRDNVPNRDELIASGVENVDMVQHRVDGSFPFTSVDSQPIKSNGISTAIKNRDNVPTRDELTASGVENVDMVQHQVDMVQHQVDETYINNKTDKLSMGDKLSQITRTGIKNRDNVPTRNELTEMGAENVDMVQHRIEDTIDLNWMLKKKESTTANVESPENKSTFDNNESATIGTKNNDTVSTNNKVLAAGDTYAHMLQHQKEFRPKGIVNLPPGAIDVTISQNSEVNGLEKNPESQIKKDPDIQAASTKSSILDSTTSMSATTTTSVKQQTINEQIAVPKHTTLSSPTDTNKQTTNSGSKTFDNSLTPEKGNNKETSESTLMTKTNVTEQTECRMIKCVETCKYGYKQDSNGCQTCTCKYSNSCPRAVPISRLLCLLQVRTSSSQNCETDSDCRRNRICCPGTCGNICRRQSRNRSLLLAMLLD